MKKYKKLTNNKMDSYICLVLIEDIKIFHNNKCSHLT